MGYTVSQQIAEGLHIIDSDGEFSLHVVMDADDKGYGRVEVSDEEMKRLIGFWISERTGGKPPEEKSRLLHALLAYDDRIQELRRLLSDAQFFLEEAEQGNVEPPELQKWQEAYKEVILSQ